MSEEDRKHWNRRYRDVSFYGDHQISSLFSEHEHLIPIRGNVLEIACGTGRLAVWLAKRGLHYRGVDVSSVAIESARDFAQASGFAQRCRFEVHDLDDGLPEGLLVDLLVSNMFRDPRLDSQIIDRLTPGGLLIISALSEVDSVPGRYRARFGELREAFGQLNLLEHGEGDGIVWLIARKT